MARRHGNGPSKTPSTGREIRSLAAGEGILMAATHLYGVHRSADSGRTWRAFGNDASRIHFVEFDSASRRFYGLGDSVLFTAGPQAGQWTPFVRFDPGTSFEWSMQSTARFSVQGDVLILLRANSKDSWCHGTRGKSWRTATYPTVGSDILSVLAADSCVYANDSESPVSVSCDGRRDLGSCRRRYHEPPTDTALPASRVLSWWPLATEYSAARTGAEPGFPGARSWWGISSPRSNPIWGLKNKGGSIYAYEYDFEIGSKHKIHRSADGGVTWTVVSRSAEEFDGDWSSTARDLKSPKWAGSSILLRAAECCGVPTAAPPGAVCASGRCRNPFHGHPPEPFPRPDRKGPLRQHRFRRHLECALAERYDHQLDHHGRLRRAIRGVEPGRAPAGIRRHWRDLETHSMPTSQAVLRLAVLGRNLYLATTVSLWRSGPDGLSWKEIPLPAADSLRTVSNGGPIPAPLRPRAYLGVPGGRRIPRSQRVPVILGHPSRLDGRG